MPVIPIVAPLIVKYGVPLATHAIVLFAGWLAHKKWGRGQSFKDIVKQ